MHLQRAVCSRINAQPPAPLAPAAPTPFLSLPARLEHCRPTASAPAPTPVPATGGGIDDEGPAVEARAPRILSVHGVGAPGVSAQMPAVARKPVKASRYAVLWLSLPPAQQLLQVLETRTGRLVPANPAEQRVGGVSIACRRSLFRLFWLLGILHYTVPYINVPCTYSYIEV